MRSISFAEEMADSTSIATKVEWNPESNSVHMEFMNINHSLFDVDVNDLQEGHKCTVCLKAFPTNWKLARHKKAVHEKIKDFQCVKCSYACSDKGTLTFHIRDVHLGIKRNHCDKCSFACNSKTNLTKHINMVHKKIRDRECDLCGKTYSTNQKL